MIIIDVKPAIILQLPKQHVIYNIFEWSIISLTILIFKSFCVRVYYMKFLSKFRKYPLIQKYEQFFS